jgi:hypothetical protein
MHAWLKADCVRRTTGVQLQSPEGAQRLRALSAATAELDRSEGDVLRSHRARGGRRVAGWVTQSLIALTPQRTCPVALTSHRATPLLGTVAWTIV